LSLTFVVCCCLGGNVCEVLGNVCVELNSTKFFSMNSCVLLQEGIFWLLSLSILSVFRKYSDESFSVIFVAITSTLFSSSKDSVSGIIVT